MASSISILAPIYIDGPCNNWWSTYGPAPNNSYLIDTNGVVVSKHGWFDKYPDNIYCDIDSLLGTTSGNCIPVGGNSSYTFRLQSADTMYDFPGTTISVDGELENTGTQDILINAKRLTNNMPAGWASSMCIDVCYATSTDSVVFLLPAGATQDVHVYFYTTFGSSDTGFVRLGFRNLNNPGNQNAVNTYGITFLPASVAQFGRDDEFFSIAPNPASAELKISPANNSGFRIEIFSLLGETILLSTDRVVDVSSLKRGTYFIRFMQGGLVETKIFVRE
jgi:hypothetical protein